MLSSAAMAFCLAGISLKVSGRILQFLRGKIDRDQIRSRLLHEQSVATQSYLGGSWSDWHFDEALIHANLRRGELFFTVNYLSWAGRIFLQNGRFGEAEILVKLLAEISGSYASDFAQAIKCFLQTNLLLQMRRVESALSEGTLGLDFMRNTGFVMLHFALLCLKVRIQTLRGDTAEADRTLGCAIRTDREVKAYPHYRSGFFLSALNYYFGRLEESLERKDGQGGRKYRKLFLSSLKRERRLLGKVAPDRTETYRITGSYYWLGGRTRLALRWWKASLDEAEKRGARLELSRTYFEVGKRVTSALLSRTGSGTEGRALRTRMYRNPGPYGERLPVESRGAFQRIESGRGPPRAGGAAEFRDRAARSSRVRDRLTPVQQRTALSSRQRLAARK